MQRTMTQKIICLVTAILFLVNDLCYGLGVSPASTRPATVLSITAAYLQKAQAENPSPLIPVIDRVFIDSETQGYPSNDILSQHEVEFITPDYNKLPDVWENDPIYQKIDLISVLKYWYYERMGVSEKDLVIIPGCGPAEKDENTFTLWHPEKLANGTPAIVVNLAADEMWKYMRANDAWFKFKAPDGKMRTASVAYGFLFSLLEKEFIKEKNGEYLPVNNIVQKWFSASPCSGRDEFRYNNENLSRSLSDAGLDPFAIALACAINRKFYGHGGPIRLAVEDFEINKTQQKKYETEYETRVLDRARAGISEEPVKLEIAPDGSIIYVTPLKNVSHADVISAAALNPGKSEPAALSQTAVEPLPRKTSSLPVDGRKVEPGKNPHDLFFKVIATHPSLWYGEFTFNDFFKVYMYGEFTFNDFFKVYMIEMHINTADGSAARTTLINDLKALSPTLLSVKKVKGVLSFEVTGCGTMERELSTKAVGPDRDIACLEGISADLMNALRQKLNVQTIGDLQKIAYEELFSTPGIGKFGAQKIQHALSTNFLSPKNLVKFIMEPAKGSVQLPLIIKMLKEDPLTDPSKDLSDTLLRLSNFVGLLMTQLNKTGAKDPVLTQKYASQVLWECGISRKEITPPHIFVPDGSVQQMTEGIRGKLVTPAMKLGYVKYINRHPYFVIKDRIGFLMVEIENGYVLGEKISVVPFSELGGTGKAAPAATKSQTTEEVGLIRVIETVKVPRGLKSSQGVEPIQALPNKDSRDIFEFVKQLHGQQIDSQSKIDQTEIFLPKRVDIPSALKNAIERVNEAHKKFMKDNNREEKPAIVCRKYSTTDNLENMLGKGAADGVRRVVIIDEEFEGNSEEETAIKINEYLNKFKDIAHFNGVRVMKSQLPNDYENLPEDKRTFHASQIVMMATALGLINKDSSEPTKMVLAAMLKGYMKGDVKEYIDNITRDENTWPVADRLKYFLGKTVSLLPEFVHEFEMLKLRVKTFWIAA